MNKTNKTLLVSVLTSSLLATSSYFFMTKEGREKMGNLLHNCKGKKESCSCGCMHCCNDK